MKAIYRILFPSALMILISLACRSATTTPTAVATQPPEKELPLVFDCLANSPACPQIAIHGESLSPLADGQEEAWRGYADPTIRMDPKTGRLWMAYSALNVRPMGASRAAPVIDTHLAFSDDGGKTWTYHSSLWKAYPVHNPATGEAGYVNHEAANILPVHTEEGILWYGIRVDYFLPENEAFRFKKRPLDSAHLVLAQAASPEKLAGAPTSILAGAMTATGWEADFDLTSLSPELSRCDIWNEPALLYQNGVLYLALRCLVFDTHMNPNIAESDLVVFAAAPSSAITDLAWRYVGVLTGEAEAQELGGEGLTQIDFAFDKNGQLLALLTPDAWVSSVDFVHYGCKIVEVETIDPPALARDVNGSLRVRAVITASDLPDLGPGACAYDPASATGIIIGRRIRQTGYFEIWLHGTQISP